MKIDVITLFPDWFSLSLKQSLIGKALEKRLFEIRIIDLRDYANDRHRTVDDAPFGGGGGMVLKLEPLDNCLKALGYGGGGKSGSGRIILTSAAGRTFNQARAIEYSLQDRLTIICGHYLGVDERLCDLYDVEELSIGDYVLTGGEPAAAVIIDAVVRLIPQTLGNFESALGDSYMEQIVGTPCYTRPAEFKNLKAPTELLSGDHEAIRKYRRKEALRKCLRNRPDLLSRAELSEDEIEFINSLRKQER